MSGRAVGLAERHGAFEHVGVGRCMVRGLVGTWNAQHVAEFREEQRIIGAFLPAVALGPTRDEGVGVGGGECGREVHELWIRGFAAPD